LRSHGAADERLVDLDLVEGEAAQISERGVSGAEIVEHQAHAERAELLQRLDGAGLGSEKRGLVDLDFEPVRIEARRVERVPHAPGEVALIELDGGKIDRNLEA